jgi:hypothetical protein
MLLRIFAALLAFSALIAPANAAVAIVSGQTKSGVQSTTSSSWTITTNAAPTVGNLDIIAVQSVVQPTAPTGWSTIGNYYVYSTNTMWVGVLYRIAQTSDPSSVTVTYPSAHLGNWVWIELSGESSTYPYYATSVTTTNTAATNTPASTFNVPSANGIMLALYLSENGSAVTTSVTDNPPSGISTTSLTFGSHADNGGVYDTIALYGTSTDPHTAAQPYSSFGTVSASQTHLASQLIWIPPAGYTPPANPCSLSVMPCVVPQQ